MMGLLVDLAQHELLSALNVLIVLCAEFVVMCYQAVHFIDAE